MPASTLSLINMFAFVTFVVTFAVSVYLSAPIRDRLVLLGIIALGIALWWH
jgi:hypothetical protein